MVSSLRYLDICDDIKIFAIDQKHAIRKSNTVVTGRTNFYNTTFFFQLDQFGRTQHWHGIGRFKEWGLLDNFDNIAH